MAEVKQRYGKLDALVNNVGDFLGIAKPFHLTSEADWDVLYATNLRHMFIVTRAALPLLREAKGGASIRDDRAVRRCVASIRAPLC